MTAVALREAVRPARTFGKLYLNTDKGRWVLMAEPHVIMVAKRLWRRGGAVTGRIYLDATKATAIDLVWFLDRYPLEMEPEHERLLRSTAAAHEEQIRRVADYLGNHIPPPPFALAIAPRDYQAREAAAVLEQGHLLNADVVGLGKTCSAIAVMSDPRALPAVVVTLTHLPQQWAAEIKKFAPGLRVHVIKGGPLYRLDPASFPKQYEGLGSQQAIPGWRGAGPPDVIITTYSKLAKWAQILADYARFVVFDECQELRRTGTPSDPSRKYEGARHLTNGPRVAYRMGLTATPIYNYGDEIHAVLECLAPGSIGARTEFLSEWCVPVGNNRHRLREPAAFGTWAREQGLMVRHTRQDVGRELPDLIPIVQEIGAEAKSLDDVSGRAGELARILVDGVSRERGDALMAGGELDRILRQATGLAKAPYVAEFVRILVESGERVLLAGWHHAVYDVWEERLKPLRVVRYTGQESPREKDEAAARFVSRDADVMMISLRSGVGLDGLQKAARVVVFGELDWSPGIHEQVVGRLRRDGQGDPVVAYYLIADSGSDPVVSEVLGIKRQQAAGVLDPTVKPDALFAAGEDRVRRLAESWLARQAK